jgi:DNA repair photolyase
MTDRAKMNGKPVFEVPAKTVINWDSGFKHKLLCDGPTFSAGTACCYSCSFCYVPAQMKKQEPWLRKHGMTGKFEEVVIRRENAATILHNELLYSKKGRELAHKSLVIYGSPLVDVAGNMDLVRETVEICKSILSETNWHIRLLSKSNLLPKVAEGLEGFCGSEGRIIYGVSTGTLDDKLARAFEQGTPLVSKRLESLHWLQDNGYRTFGMICPSIPHYNYMAFSREMMQAIRAEKCEHVWAEVMNVRGDSMKRTYKAMHDAGYIAEAKEIDRVTRHKDAWEEYARATFTAHVSAIADRHAMTLQHIYKLRFLQYVTASTIDWWKEREKWGAVLL